MRYTDNTSRRHWLTRASAVALAAAAIASPAAWAQAPAFPNKTLKLVVPFGAGGSDVMGRAFAEKLSSILKQPVIVENKPGAAGQIGSEYVASAPADGYTMLFIGGGSLTPILIKDLKFDMQKSLRPVISIARGGMTFMTNSQIPVKDMKEFIEYAKKNAGKLNYSYTAGSMVLSTEMLKSKAGFEATAVPYKGAAQVLTALITNEIQMTVDVPFNYMAMIKDGRVKPLVHGGQERSPTLPDVPTLAELGINDLIFAVSYGIWVPAGTPDAVVNQLNAAYNEVLKDPGIRERLTQAAMVPTGGPPEGHTKQIALEQKMWGDAARKIGFKPE
ncbi:MAG: tripartite tricarboxylate transporter substrate binding protein [Burkholderiales bacterium]|nr:tripartite tricarboxylate transporter substrate binding protein [Burkholderiales bacterium]